MNLRMEVDASSALRALAKAPEATRRHLRIGLQIGTVEVADHAQGHHRFITRTGGAEKAVSTRFEEPMTGIVFLDPSKPVASMLHQGTRPHAIFPKLRKALRWVTQGGGFGFARRIWHPGTKSDPFLFDALRAKEERLRSIFSNSTMDAFREAGLA